MSRKPFVRHIDAFLHNLGFGHVERGRGMLVLDRSRHPAVSALLAACAEQLPRMNRYYMGSESDFSVAVQPIPMPWSADRFRRNVLERLKIHALIVSAPTAADRHLLRVAESMGILVRDLDALDNQHAQADSAAALPSSELSLDVLRKLVADIASPARAGRQASDPAARNARQPGPLQRFWIERAFHDIGRVSELAARLAYPQTIVCLGNGPSSEDVPRGMYDSAALFRVNHSWLRHAAQDTPQVIFTGQLATLKACGTGPVFVLPSLDSYRKIQKYAWTLRGRYDCLNAEAQEVYNVREFSPYKPTNGAVMIATAVALAPARIVIAGIDFFSDPRGAYAGGVDAVNAYTQAHDRDLEVRFILAALSRFQGEVVIFGDVLNELWQSNRESAASSSKFS